MKIVMVDDDPVVCSLMDDFLTAHGYELEILSCGTECLNRVAEEKPDIVFLDMVMPDMSGIEVLKKLKNNSDTESIPVVMLSANDEPEEFSEDSSVRPDYYLAKPFRIKKILEILKSRQGSPL